ncbi:hypothetical protein D3C83_235410 [compost metagenome]
MLKHSGRGIQVRSKVEPVVEVAAPFIDLGGIALSHPRLEVRLELGAGIVLSIARG